MVRIRLARGGAKKRPFYRIVAADKRMKRDGRFLEKLGTYDPLVKEVTVNKEGIEKWLAEGAVPTDTVIRLLNKEGFDLKTTYAAKPKTTKEEKEVKEPVEAKEEKEVEKAEEVKEEKEVEKAEEIKEEKEVKEPVEAKEEKEVEKAEEAKEE